MAKLRYSQSLTLNLWEAADVQESGATPVIGANVPVTLRLYAEIYGRLQRNKKLEKALRKITSKSMEKAWEKIRGHNDPLIRFPQGQIYVTPCIHSLTLRSAFVRIPFPIDATSPQAESVLRECLGKSDFVCVGQEIHVVVEMGDGNIVYDLKT
jgi:hypothetical protein